MLFEDSIGQNIIKKHLIESAKIGRVPHAQIFAGKEGSGTLPIAIAYAQYLLCNSNENKDSCIIKCEKLQHPDLHFAFPVTTNDKIKKHPVSDLFLEEWREFIKINPYGSVFNWLQYIGVENKQGMIGVDEAEDIVKKLSLKSYEGGLKVMIIWMAEKMNTIASNKLLKLIEEPPKKTIFILITEDAEQIIKTITSRCQIINFNKLTEREISDSLIKKEKIDESDAIRIAQQSEGNYNKALELITEDNKDSIFEEWFVFWVRTAFKAKGNPTAIQDLITWSNSIAKEGRETQKKFIQFCLQFFRQALLLNYGATDLVYILPKVANFKLEKFAPFIHSNNIINITSELNTAQYHIERNGNAKIILLDLSVKLTRLLHTKES